MNDFAILLNTLRKEQGLTQTELADKLGVTNQAVSKWETGESYPETAMLITLSEIFNISVDDLLKGKNSKKRTPALKNNVPSDFRKKYAFLLASGVFCFFIGVIAIILYGLLDEKNAINGVMILFGTIIAGVSIIVYNSIIYAYYYLETNREEYKQKVKRFAFGITLGVALCILGVTTFVATGYAENAPTFTTILMVAGFLIIAVAVALFIIFGTNWGTYVKQLAEENIIIPTDEHEKTGLSRFSGIVMLMATAIFLAIGFILDVWHPTWAVFPIGGLICGILSAIDDAKGKKDE